jgi:hypothetical protein
MAEALTPEDEKAMKLLGITSREKFLEARAAEAARIADRGKPAPTTPAPKPTPKADATPSPALCPSCSHVSHPCIEPTCKCGGSSTGTLSSADAEVIARLGIEPAAFLKMRADEARARS